MGQARCASVISDVLPLRPIPCHCVDRSLLDGVRVDGVERSRRIANSSPMYRRCIGDASATSAMHRRCR
eukprot:9489266-Pyramimonas_sp.AAC.1